MFMFLHARSRLPLCEYSTTTETSCASCRRRSSDEPITAPTPRGSRPGCDPGRNELRRHRRHDLRRDSGKALFPPGFIVPPEEVRATVGIGGAEVDAAAARERWLYDDGRARRPAGHAGADFGTAPPAIRGAGARDARTEGEARALGPGAKNECCREPGLLCSPRSRELPGRCCSADGSVLDCAVSTKANCFNACHVIRGSRGSAARLYSQLVGAQAD